MSDPDLFARAGSAIASLSSRQRYDERNRLALLVIHGWIGVAVFALILKDGPPEAWAAQFHDPNGWRLGAPGLIGGALLLTGLTFGRRLWLEAAGMTVMLLWDLGLAALFWHSAVTNGNARTYPIAIYFGLAALMSVHIGTLVRYLRGRG